MAPSAKTSFKTYEAQTRLLAAVIATNKGIKLDYKALAAHCGKDVSAHSIDHRLRPIKQLGKMQAKCVQNKEDPGELPVEKSEIQKAYGESTPDGLEWQFRGVKKLAAAQNAAVKNGESPASIDVHRVTAPGGGGTSTPRSRGTKSATTTPRTGGTVKTPGSRASKASTSTISADTPPTYGSGANIFNNNNNNNNDDDNDNTGSGAITPTAITTRSASGSAGQKKRSYREISDDADSDFASAYQGDSGDTEYCPDPDETPTGRKKRQQQQQQQQQQARFPNISPVGGYNVGGSGTTGATGATAAAKKTNNIGSGSTSSSFFDDGDGNQFEIIDLADDDFDEEIRGHVKKEPMAKKPQQQQQQQQAQAQNQSQSQSTTAASSFGGNNSSSNNNKASYGFGATPYSASPFKADPGPAHHAGGGGASDDFDRSFELDDGEV